MVTLKEMDARLSEKRVCMITGLKQVYRNVCLHKMRSQSYTLDEVEYNEIKQRKKLRETRESLLDK